MFGSTLVAQQITLVPHQDDPIVITGPKATVGDVYTIQGASEEQRESLAAITLASLSAPGSTYHLYGFHVERQLQSAGFGDDFRMEGDYPIALQADEVQISSQEIAQQITGFLKEQTSAELEWSFVREPSLTAFPDESYRIQFSNTSDILPGKFALQGTLINGSYRGTFSTLIEVLIQQPVLVATEEITPGTFLNRENTIVETRPLGAREYKTAVTEQASQIELETIRHISAGEIVLTSMVEKVQLIHSGDQVNLLVEHGAVKIQSRGNAIESGGLQDKIRVRDSQSGKVVVGIVENNNTVKVNLTENL